MARYYDIDSLKVNCINVGTVMFPRMEKCILMKDIESSPTADVVPVIRCKNCGYANDDGTICHYGVGRDVKPDHYCGYGERRITDG